MRQIAVTGCCNKSPRVTCENHCRCDILTPKLNERQFEVWCYNINLRTLLRISSAYVR